MIEDYLYRYYPRGLKNGFSNEYLESKEYKNLLQTINNALKWDLSKIKHELSNVNFHKISPVLLDVSNLNFNDRCFNFQYRFINSKSIDFICINISVLGPFACIYHINRPLNLDIRIGSKIMNPDFFEYNFNNIPPIYKQFISQCKVILRNHNLFLINNKKLNEGIPNISFENIKYNEMTVFNCLFMNEPYCLM